MALEGVTAVIGMVARAIFGSRNERLLRAYRQVIEKASALEGEFEGLSDEALAAKTEEFRGRVRPEVEALLVRLERRGSLDDAEIKKELGAGLNAILEPLIPEAFAAVREAAKRCVWLGHAEAAPDYHPDIQDRIRKAMRREASLVAPDTGKPIDTHGLYGMRPYDVQLVAGLALHEGKLSELATGEGKTLCATFPAYLNSLAGRGVHVVSTNDYLVRVGREWNEPIFRRLGVSVGAIQADMDSRERQVQYACDITYGTNNEFGFDYLRDNMKTSAAEQVQSRLAYAIVDEADSVLIDEARTPLIISGPAFESTDKYMKADAIARALRAPRSGYPEDKPSEKGGDPEADFLVMHKEHQCPLTEKGVHRAEEIAGVGSFYVAGNMDWPHLIDQALRAHHLYELDKNYVVQGEDVIIVDEFTGRLMPGRQWSDGLHQAVEAKEQIRVKEETQTLATITLQNYFRMYDKLAGMTATAMTEAGEFDKIYKLEVVSIPTNRPLSRAGHADVVYRTLKEKLKAVVDEIKDYSDRGRPVLVGTTSIEMSERLSGMLERAYGIPHEVLNAKFHEKEAEIVAHAGERHEGRDGQTKGNVTIATNMAGRGTDIKLGTGVVYANCFGPWDVQKRAIPSDFGNKCCVGCLEYNPRTHCAHCFKPKVAPEFPERGRTECLKDPPCGLHVIGTERHEARRIDNQLRGRSGRQGDPGSSRFFLSLEDDLMRIFAKDWVSTALEKLGMEEGMALEHAWLSRGIQNAQKKVEERNFDFRKHLLEYDEVMDRQRKIFYGRRQRILESPDLGDFVWDLLTESVEEAVERYLSDIYSFDTIAEWAGRNLAVQVDAAGLQGRDEEQIRDFLTDEALEGARDSIEESIGEFLPQAEDVEEGEPPPKPDYRSLAQWAEGRLGIKFAESDLKRLPPDEIGDRLYEAARQRVAAIDFAPIAEYLASGFREAALADWANQKFDMGLSAADFAGINHDAARELLIRRLQELYAEKERSYPIEFAIEEYLTPQVGQGNQDFEGLAEWASRYYLTEVNPHEVRSRRPETVREKLLAIAREFESSGRLDATVRRGVKEHLPKDRPEEAEAWRPLAAWSKEALGLEITAEQMADAWQFADADYKAFKAEQRRTGEPQAYPEPPEAIVQLLEARARADRRIRMTELERYLLLQVHDTSWKDHLLTMDHLKGGVGLRGYAQMDPLIEFKRDGLESFEKMLEGARERFADLIFKARWVRQDALARIWAGQESEHAVAASAYEAQRRAALDATQQAQMAEEGESAVQTIVRAQPKVGRNDPCPCGSGKKYKKCCGRRA